MSGTLSTYTEAIAEAPIATAGGAAFGDGAASKAFGYVTSAPKAVAKAYLWVGDKIGGAVVSAGAPAWAGALAHYWWGVAVLLLLVAFYGLAWLVALPMRLLYGKDSFDPYGDALLKKFNAKVAGGDRFFSAPEVVAEGRSGFFSAPEVYAEGRSGFFSAPDEAASEAAARARSEKMVINPMIECLGLTDAQCRSRLAGETMVVDPRLAALASPDSGYAQGAETMINPRVAGLQPAAENYSPKPRSWKKHRFESGAYATQAARAEKYTNYVSSAQPAFGSTLLTGTRNQGDAAASGAAAEAYALKTLGAI